MSEFAISFVSDTVATSDSLATRIADAVKLVKAVGADD
jgi:hypothetical protein